MKEFDADRSLFKLIDGALKNFFDDVAEKLLTAMASAKRGSLCKFIEVRPERLHLLWIVEYPVEVAGAGKIGKARSHWLTGL
jgi:hypothetical protein